MTYTVYFRTGGTQNFRWRRVLEVYPARYQAIAKVKELERAGYPAYYEVTSLLDRIGLPETYEAKRHVLQ